MVAAAATIASTALPPSRSTDKPACAARWWGATTMPRRDEGVFSMFLAPDAAPGPCRASVMSDFGNAKNEKAFRAILQLRIRRPERLIAARHLLSYKPPIHCDVQSCVEKGRA